MAFTDFFFSLACGEVLGTGGLEHHTHGHTLLWDPCLVGFPRCEAWL